MLTPIYRPYSKQICSYRCYQRDYRKRRRGHNSVVAWKVKRPNYGCVVCKKPLSTNGRNRISEKKTPPIAPESADSGPIGGARSDRDTLSTANEETGTAG